LVLKRNDWKTNPHRFPQGGIHGSLVAALAEVLTHSHRLVVNVKQLKREREHADYELQPPTVLEEDAETAMDVSFETLEEQLPAVTQEQWQAIADTVYDLDQDRKKSAESDSG
jgi:hypothetical protein